MGFTDEDAAYFGVWGGMPEYAGKRGGFLRNNEFAVLVDSDIKNTVIKVDVKFALNIIGKQLIFTNIARGKCEAQFSTFINNHCVCDCCALALIHAHFNVKRGLGKEVCCTFACNTAIKRQVAIHFKITVIVNVI